MTEELNIFSTAPAADLRSAPATPEPPNSVEAAKEARQQRLNDPEWVNRYQNGDTDAKKEMLSLNQIISGITPEQKTESVLAGNVKPTGGMEFTTDGVLTTQQYASAAEGMRKLGATDKFIRDAINGNPISAEEKREVEMLKERLFDPKWRSQLSNFELKQWVLAISGSIVRPVKE